MEMLENIPAYMGMPRREVKEEGRVGARDEVVVRYRIVSIFRCRNEFEWSVHEMAQRKKYFAKAL